MPTNLPPEYYEVEKEYRAAQDPAEKAALLEELLGTIPKHKGTDKLRAGLRKRLAKLKEAAKSQKRKGGPPSAYRIDREGAGQVVVIGPANVGKSALVATLTNATPEVSEAPFTTWKPTPGMVLVENVQIQLIDTPPLDREYIKPEMIEMIKRADLILLLLDLQTYPEQQLQETVDILLEYHIIPAHLKGGYPIERRTKVIPLLVLANKCDDQSCDEVYELFTQLLDEEWPMLPLSVTHDYNLGMLKQAIFDQLGIMRIYSKAPFKEPDLSAPFVMKHGSTVEEFAVKIHQDFYQQLTTARVWGSSMFDGQMVQRDYVLQDEDIVELRI